MTSHVRGVLDGSLLFAACALQLVACGPAAHPPPARPRAYPACVREHPVNLAVDPSSLATAATPHAIDIPVPLWETVMRSGIDTVWYAGEVCGGAPPTFFSVEHSTGFPDLDRFLDEHISELGLDLPTWGCVSASIRLRQVDRGCDPP
jgi:hypothetical protein